MPFAGGHFFLHAAGRIGNAMESFFSSLKIERIRGKIHRTRDAARIDVLDDIERF